MRSGPAGVYASAGRLLALLPAAYRAVVQRWAVEGCTHEEIGRMLGREGSKTRLHRARTQIRNGDGHAPQGDGEVSGTGLTRP